MDDLLFAVLGLIELGSLVHIFHSEAQPAVDEPGEFGGHRQAMPAIRDRAMIARAADILETVKRARRTLKETSTCMTHHTIIGIFLRLADGLAEIERTVSRNR